MKISWIDPSRNADPGPVLQQHPAYAAALARLGREVRLARIGEFGHAQVILRRAGRLGGLALLPRGPDWNAPRIDPDLAGEALRGLCRALPLPGLRKLIVNAETPGKAEFQRAGFLPLVTPQHLAELDLTGGDEARLARASGKWRNQLRKAQASGLQIREARFPPDPGHWLLRCEAQQRKARGYGALPLSFAPAYAAANPGKARLFTAEHGGAPLAAMLVLLHFPGASYHIGWSGPAGRSTQAHNLLLWHIGGWLAQQGFTTLDLGQVDTESAPGLARFKIGSGADIRSLGTTWIHAPIASGLLRMRGIGRSRTTPEGCQWTCATSPSSPMSTTAKPRSSTSC